MIDYTVARRAMVDEQLAARGIRDPRLLAAFAAVPREKFVDPQFADEAYEDMPLPIAAGQTISQPYIVALTIEALDLHGHERVLDVGTGSGYAAAVVSRLCRAVWTIERHHELAEQAARVIGELGYDNITLREGDGSLGWPEAAPFDAIAVAAAGPQVPPALLEQLAIGGRMVIPVGKSIEDQRLLRITRTGETQYSQETLAAVRFVPLVGKQAWAERTR
jgi:protein-L-isoaspartate(D-aspartate) O-methyltransferase